jgi:hypothetical protein
MMDSECGALKLLEVAFLYWQDVQKEWCWHRAQSTNKVYVDPPSRCKGPKPRDKCRGEIIMEVKWKAAGGGSNAKKTLMKIESSAWEYGTDWVILNRIAQKRPSKN